MSRELNGHIVGLGAEDAEAIVKTSGPGSFVTWHAAAALLLELERVRLLYREACRDQAQAVAELAKLRGDS